MVRPREGTDPGALVWELLIEEQAETKRQALVGELLLLEVLLLEQEEAEPETLLWEKLLLEVLLLEQEETKPRALVWERLLEERQGLAGKRDEEGLVQEQEGRSLQSRGIFNNIYASGKDFLLDLKSSCQGSTIPSTPSRFSKAIQERIDLACGRLQQ